jgi:hypothetical protein
VESRPESRPKAELLDALVRYLLRRGVSDLSCARPQPRSGRRRMLIYYFGSPERLLFAAMEGR